MERFFQNKGQVSTSLIGKSIQSNKRTKRKTQQNGEKKCHDSFQKLYSNVKFQCLSQRPILEKRNLYIKKNEALFFYLNYTIQQVKISQPNTFDNNKNKLMGNTVNDLPKKNKKTNKIIDNFLFFLSYYFSLVLIEYI